VSDLRGHVVSTGAPGAGTTVMAERILAAAGLNPVTDIRAHNLGVAQSVDALKDGKVDAFFWNGGLPTAAVLDLVNTQGIAARLLPLDDALPELRRRHGESLYYRAVIPAATYNLPADVPVVAVANLLVVSDAMPEGLAHDITRILFEQQPTLAGAVSGIGEALQLNLGVLNRLNIRIDLRRQLAAIARAIFLQLLFMLDQPALGIFELRVEERIRVLRDILAIPQVLFDEQRREPFSGLLGRPRITADIRHAKRLFALDLDEDVVARADAADARNNASDRRVSCV
jgi:hypothetical protein